LKLSAKNPQRSPDVVGEATVSERRRWRRSAAIAIVAKLEHDLRRLAVHPQIDQGATGRSQESICR
jgi:hypothetical protein